MIISNSYEDAELKSKFRSSSLWVRESFSAMCNALPRNMFVDPTAAFAVDRGNLCTAKDCEFGFVSDRPKAKTERRRIFDRQAKLKVSCANRELPRRSSPALAELLTKFLD
jgi:hypothetical protein